MPVDAREDGGLAQFVADQAARSGSAVKAGSGIAITAKAGSGIAITAK